MSNELLPPIAVLSSASDPTTVGAAANEPGHAAPAKKTGKGKDKENVSLQQTSLAPYVKSSGSSMGKKRSFSLANGLSYSVDDKTLPVTKEVVEAMRLRIIELEDQLAGQPPAKKVRTSKTATKDAEPAPAPATSSTSTATTTDPNTTKLTAQEAKKIDALTKKMWNRLQKELKTDRCKFRNNCKSVTVRLEEVIEKREFFHIFTPTKEHHIRGGLIQPTKENKPNSSVWILIYEDEGVQDIFGKHYNNLTGNLYSMGGICAQFEKGKKMGTCDLEIEGLEVSYSMNTMKCALKFEVVNERTCFW